MRRHRSLVRVDIEGVVGAGVEQPERRISRAQQNPSPCDPGIDGFRKRDWARIRPFEIEFDSIAGTNSKPNIARNAQEQGLTVICSIELTSPRILAQPQELNPSLYGTVEVKRQASRRTPLTRTYQFVGSTEGVSSSRSRFHGAPPAAAVKAGRHCAGATRSVVTRPRLDGGEPGARLDGRDDRSRDRRQDMILDWAANDACGKHRITLYPVRDESPGP
jgi:hypothetical protein